MVGDQQVSPISHDREEEAQDDSVGEEEVGTPPGGGEALCESKGGLGQGQVSVEVV